MKKQWPNSPAHSETVRPLEPQAAKKPKAAGLPALPVIGRIKATTQPQKNNANRINPIMDYFD